MNPAAGNPVSEDRHNALEQRVDKMEDRFDERENQLFSIANDTRDRVTRIETDMGYVRGDVNDLKRAVDGLCDRDRDRDKATATNWKDAAWKIGLVLLALIQALLLTRIA